jgi:23S rRNA (guanosine2251-2'-O)-methyltransferase
VSGNELVYGLHSVEALLRRSPDRVTSLLIAQNTHNFKINQLITVAEAAGIPIKKVDREGLDKMTSGSTHQGVVAQCSARVQYSESDIIPLLAKVNGPPFLLILDQVEDPHNLGACLRVADAAGIHLVITPKHHSTSITPTVSKVACGAAETVPFIQVTNLSQCIRKLQKEGIWVFGMAGEAEMSLYQSDLTGPLALVTGAEGTGLRRLTRECCDSLLHIPMHGTVSSLNVSVATGICLFEAVRQRPR